MRALFLVLFGVACGVVGTVLFTTVNPAFNGDERDTAGGGNARISLDEDALATLIRANLADLPGGDAMKVTTDIQDSGIVAVRIVVGAGALDVGGTMEIDPDVVDGRLKLNVVSSSLGKLAVPDAIVERIQRPLQERLDALAGEHAYRLTSIATADGRLTLEIAL